MVRCKIPIYRTDVLKPSDTVNKKGKLMSKPTVIGVERVLDIFESFQEYKNPMSMTDLADATGIPKSTCHAILTTLQKRGYVYSLNRPRAHYPTNRLYDVASEIMENDVFVRRATPLIEKLRDITGETVILGKRHGDEAIYLQVVEGSYSIRYSAKNGDLKPLHSSAIGKALLGSMRLAELEAFAQNKSFAKVTDATITDPAALVEEIQKSKKLGYFKTCGENVSDVWAISSSLKVGSNVFAIAVAGPGNRMENFPSEYLLLLVGSCSVLSNMASSA